MMKIKLNIHCLLCGLLLFAGQALYSQTTMPRMIQVGQEVIRINPTQPNQIQYSTNGGRIWMTRFTGSSTGDFIDLIAYKNELIAITTKGIYYSQNNGRMWSVRYSGTAFGTFQTLTDGGNELLALTTKGLYYSTNSGRIWIFRHN